MKKVIVFLILGFCCFSSTYADTAQIAEAYGKIPLAFTLNQGQTDSQVKFTSAGNGCSMFFTPTGTTFLLSRETEQSVAKRSVKISAEDMTPTADTEREYESFAAKTVFVDANQNPEVVGEERLAWNNNYFIGSEPAKWQTDVPNYGKIRMKEVYSGIDLVYYGNKNHIKYDFVVKPGENPSQIVLKYDLGADGGNSLSINANGELVVKTPLGDIIEKKPYAYQKIDGKDAEVSIAYKIIDASANSFGFEIGAFNTNTDLYIDPELVYSTFLGGSEVEIGDNDRIGVAVDSSGNTYITGTTYSPDFPVTALPIDGHFDGASDGFVCKLNSSGTALVYSTYIGGTRKDCLNAIAVDSAGNAYVTGWSNSSNFPTTHGEKNKGNNDITVVKINASGNALEYATMFGGLDSEDSWAITLDSSGHAYVVGRTWSINFPTTEHAYDQNYKGNRDGFVAELTVSGDAFVYSTFLGGNNYDALYDICIDDDGNAYVVGDSFSSDYPTTNDAYDRTYHGGYDIIISKLNPTGTALVYSTYIGGNDNDAAYFMSLDSERNVYFSGASYSLDYPTTANAFDTTHNGYVDVICGKLDVSGSNLLYSSFVGGTGGDWGSAISVCSSGIMTITGSTDSKNFPTTADGFDTANNGNSDVFLIRIDPNSANQLVFSSYLGGRGVDRGCDMAVDSNNCIYLSGITRSADFPTTTMAFDQSHNGGHDAFITKLSLGVTTEEILPVAEAADAGWINRYAYTFDGADYVIIDPDDDTPIPAWHGFWAGTNENVDLLIPKTVPEPSVPSDPGLDLTMVPDKWYFVSAPLNPTAPELGSVFSSLGTGESTWRAVKWDYSYAGGEDTGGYDIYTGSGTLPQMIPGRGFWVKQINDDTRSIRITGAPVRPSGDYYELRLPAKSSGIAAHMVGNPYWYPVHWGDMMIRKPSTGTNPMGKRASGSGSADKWYVGIKLQSSDGIARDMYNRAGVVTTTGVDSDIFNAMDLIPPDSYVDVNLTNPADTERDGLAYDFRAVGQTEYQWELNLSTSYSSKTVQLSLDNLANVPEGVQFTLKDMSTGEIFTVAEDFSISLTLNAGTTHKYLLTAKSVPTGVEDTHPVSFGITGVNPNPFNPSTTVNFNLEKSGSVKLNVYNITGQLVETLTDGVMAPGKHSVVWNARGCSSGVYLVVLESNGKNDTRKMSLMK